MHFKKPVLDIYLTLLYRLLSLLAIYTFCRLGFYFFNIGLFPGIGFKKLLIILLGGLKFDLVAIIYLNLLYIFLYTFPISFKYHSIYQNVCKWLFYSTNIIGITTNFIDFSYYKFTLKRTTASVFQQFEGEQNLPNLFKAFLLDYWYLLILLIIFCWLLIYLYNSVKIRKIEKYSWKIFLIQTLLFGITIGLCIIGVRGGWRHSTRPITLSNAGEYVDTPNEMSLVLNTPFSILKTLKAEKLEMIHTFSEGELEAIYNPIHIPHTKAPFNKLNVVFIIVESLGKEHIGALNTNLLNGTYKGYTPFLDSLVKESLTFTHTYANGRKSIDALPSILSGIPSIKEPFVLSVYSGNKTTSIAKILGDEGYGTSFFHGAPEGSMGFSSYTKLAGIEHYYGKTAYGNDADFDGIWGIWDEPFLQFMANKLNTFKQPFFSTVFTVSSHHPFKVPAQYQGKFPKGPLPVQEPVGYTDLALQKFFQTAKKMPWYANTLFVICADHATVSYLPTYKTIPGEFSIPILFYYPGGNLKGMKDKVVQQIDILPTVLNYLNYPKPYFAFGFDALTENADNFAINNNNGAFNVFKKDYLLVNDGKHSNAFYNLKTDSLTHHNLVNKKNADQEKMEIVLKAFNQQYNNRMLTDQLTVK